MRKRVLKLAEKTFTFSGFYFDTFRVPTKKLRGLQHKLVRGSYARANRARKLMGLEAKEYKRLLRKEGNKLIVEVIK